MHQHLILLAQSTTSTTTAKSSSSSGSYVPLVVIIAIFAVVYIFFIRPRQQRMRQQQTAAKQLSVGDEVMSAGGIYGRVVALDDDEVEVEVAPGVVMTFIRRAVSARQKPSGGARETPEPADEPWHLGPQGSADSGTGGPATETGGEDYPPAPGPTGG